MQCRKRQSSCSTGRRRREQLDDAHLALGEAVLPLVLDPVHRVPLRLAVDLGDGVELLARAAPPLLRIGEPEILPPCLRAREHAGASRADGVVDRREEPVGLVGVGQPDGDVRRLGVLEREAARIGLGDDAGRRQPVAEAAVDRRLRRPERRDRLAPAADVVELAAHEVAQDPAAPVRRQDADPGDAGARQLAARDREIERVRAREARPACRCRRRRAPATGGRSFCSRSQSCSSSSEPNAPSAASIAARSSSSAGGLISMVMGRLDQVPRPSGCDPSRGTRG